MNQRRYANADAFKQALEARLRKKASELGQTIPRVRQRAVFDRFVARIFQHFGDRAVLKGGVALELFLSEARMTRDVDFAFYGSSEGLQLELARAGQLELGDFMTFEIQPHATVPTIEGPGVVYDGFRFQVEARLAGKIYGDRFGLDVAFGDRMAIPPATLPCGDLFSFANLPQSQARVYAREVHLAEKLHAYTLPRLTENSRIKDLPDIVVLGTSAQFRSDDLRRAIVETFSHRASHPIPDALPRPPERWTGGYARMARENNLPWPTLDDVFQRASAFLNPILASENGTWNPDTWSWQSSA
ncbi:MAG: nucleotidyl transferase AbiEii/AbiGii toxin family protein [Polyangiaceae bacterium]|nr:nucleotidyl transferase AbiEii/AbiGii toxin family protein [Polyangiaceae bacterium]